MASRSDHYFSSRPQAPSRRRHVSLVLPDLQLDLATDRGVFSPNGVDPGTKALLLYGPPPPPGEVDVLDLGAGYGPIAITLARRAPEATVWALDVNERALSLCAENAAAAGVANRLRAVTPDDVPGDITFAQIWSNPPIRIGKGALHALLGQWLDRLTADGTAALVVHKHLGGDSLQRWLTTEGWSARRHGSKGGYRILDVAARPAEAQS